MVMTVKNPQIQFQGQYEKMTFEPGPGTEYPKAIYDKPGGKLLGIVENLKQEHDLLQESGIDHNVPDPLAAVQAELAELKAKLARYEGPAPSNVSPPQPQGSVTPQAVGAKPPNPLIPPKVMAQPAPGVAIPKPGA